jgi:hypothetical protein
MTTFHASRSHLILCGVPLPWGKIARALLGAIIMAFIALALMAVGNG